MAAAASSRSAQTDADNPWPGLASYGEGDSRFFKGRDAEIDELLRLVRGARVAVLYGASGLGKTSLLRAGLTPRLVDAGELPVYLRLDFSDTAAPCDAQVLAAIATAAATHEVEVPPRAEGDGLWAWLHRRGTAFWGPRNRLVVPVLIFDQFEEVFTRGLATPARADAVRAFLADLADLAEGRPPSSLMAALDRDPDAAAGFDFGQHRYRLLFSLREDYLAPLDELRTAMPSIMGARLRLQPMDGVQALRVADQTGGRLVDTAVAEQIVRIAAGRPLHDKVPPSLPSLHVDSALLGLFCRELNRRRQADRLPRITAELVSEGHRNILQAFYDECVRAVPPALRAWIEDELLTAGGHRDSRVLEDALALPGVAPRDVDALIDARLLRAEERNGVRRVELSHDVLTRVVRASRDARRLQETLQAEQAAERARLERERQEAELKALRESQRANGEAERRAAEAETAQRALRRRLWVVVALTAVAAGMAVVAWRQAAQARTAQATAERQADELRWQTEQLQAAAAANKAALEAARQALAAAEAAMARSRGPAPVGAAPPPAPPAVVGAIVGSGSGSGSGTGTGAAPRPSVPPPAPSPAPGDDPGRLLAQASRSYDSARQEAQRLTQCPAGMRVYPQVGSADDKARFDATLRPALRQAGFIVPPVEVVATGRLPSRAQLRYFRAAEQGGAESAAAALRDAGLGDVAATYIRGFEDSQAMRPCHYELWLPAGR